MDEMRKQKVENLVKGTMSSLQHAMEDENLPESLRDGLMAYCAEGREPGGFMRAVLENDLAGAVFRADLKNQRTIVQFVNFLNGRVPNDCWGSKEKVSRWIKDGGMRGYYKSLIGVNE